MISINIPAGGNLRLCKNNETAKSFFLINQVINNVFCPICSSYSKKSKIYRSLNVLYLCLTCGKTYSNKSNTFLADTKLKFNIVYLLLKLFVDDFRPSQSLIIVNDYIEENISLKTIRNFFAKLRTLIRRDSVGKLTPEHRIGVARGRWI